MRKAETSDSGLREQLKAEKARFKALSEQKRAILDKWVTERIRYADVVELDSIRSQLKDSAEQIAYLYKKLHPYFPVGTCPICHSVTTKIIGSGRNHWGCVACDYEGIE